MDKDSIHNLLAGGKNLTEGSKLHFRHSYFVAMTSKVTSLKSAKSTILYGEVTQANHV